MFRLINRRREWYQLPFFLAVVNLALLRTRYREHNLFDTERNRSDPPDQKQLDVRRNRTLDGSYNDLEKPTMGGKDTRFGRNVPIAETFGETESLLTPSPREVSRKLLARDEFVPATTLNILAAGWLQFMVHDWFSHGKNAKDDPIVIPLKDDDDWHERDGMTVRRTMPDPRTVHGDDDQPATFRNTETQWWDGSQIYGSTIDRARRIRAGGDGELAPDGKIALDEYGHLPLDKNGLELAGVNGNWWIGLSVIHTLFAREHNTIVDRLTVAYPAEAKDPEWLFHKARLINAALIAKIHTVEWTPALLNTPELRFGMRGNWWGILDEWFWNAYGRVSDSELISGIIGSPQDHHSAAYAITEEFVAVYRMHSLLPETISVRRLADDAPIEDERDLLAVSGTRTHEVYRQEGRKEIASLADVLYSLGTRHPGAMTLNNLSNQLRNLEKQPGSDHQADPKAKPRVVDLGAIDILRDRERGVPRYCRFRRLLGMKAPRNFDELRAMASDRKAVDEIEKLYDDVEQVDLLIGCLTEAPPPGFAFGDTAFRIFILMASRRLKSDRFFTDDFTPEVYTELGMVWIRDNGMASVLKRHCPDLTPKLDEMRNAFFPWQVSCGA